MEPKEEFLRLVDKYIKRNGIGQFIQWLGSTDFFTAPASTRHHGAEEGGLVLHSLNVYANLKKLCGWYRVNDQYSEESIALVSLMHDICKVGCYKEEMRWRKDNNNQWEQYSTWKFDEDFAFGGHGSKSVYLLQHFVKLTPEEASAINCHMGQWEATQYGNPSTVYSRNKLAWLLHVADEEDSYYI